MVEGGLDPDDIEASLWDTRGGLGTAIGGDDTLDEQFEVGRCARRSLNHHCSPTHHWLPLMSAGRLRLAAPVPAE